MWSAEWWSMKARDKVSPFPVFRRYIPGDIDDLDLHPCFEGDDGCRERCAAIAAQSQLGVAYTILDESGTPLAVAGGFFLYSKVLEIWTLVDKRMVERPKFYSHAIKFLLEHQFDMLQLDRMQVHLRADQPWTERWGKFLGFEIEGTLKKYGEEGVDYFRFAKVR